MLTSLTIQNIVTIENLTMDFQAGLCVLSGETGAGKSILLDSLGLATGGRADSGLVRHGADQAMVSAVFEEAIDQGIYDALAETGLNVDAGEPIILRRVLSRDGKSKAFINDQAVSAALLRQLGAGLLEIHGQFDTQGLLDAATHRAILDEFAGIGSDVPRLWNGLREAQERLQTLREQAAKARRDEDYLRGALDDLDRLDPRQGEEAELASLRERLMHKSQALEALNGAYHILSGEDDPSRKAASVIGRAVAKIGNGADEILAALDRASAEVNEAVNLIEALSDELNDSEHSLESIDDRLHELRAQARKHGCAVDDLPAKRDEISGSLRSIYNAGDLQAEAEAALSRALQAYKAAAQEIHDKRVKAARKLDALVMAELAPLKLERAIFTVDVMALDEGEWGPHGMDRVTFLVATNPGAAPGPLHKIASGGEMSRFMLAIKVVMAAIGPAKTMIFDEVDSGIGGSTADAVGERLSRLASGGQVLVVTHSPQVAARGDHHWIVQKGGEKSVTTAIRPSLSRAARAEEIARMLSGASVTSEARAAAEKLLESAA